MTINHDYTAFWFSDADVRSLLATGKADSSACPEGVWKPFHVEVGEAAKFDKRKFALTITQEDVEYLHVHRRIDAKEIAHGNRKKEATLIVDDICAERGTPPG